MVKSIDKTPEPKFRPGNFDVDDAPRSGRPVEADEGKIRALRQNEE